MKLPPIEKVYEAWSAIADGRVSVNADNTATVSSSDGQRTYTIKYNPLTDTYYSNDNATVWQHYPGYPILAFMMVNGTLPLDFDFCQQWAGINWNQLNSEYKRDYAAAVKHIEHLRDIDAEDAESRAQNVMSILQALPIHVKRFSTKST